MQFAAQAAHRYFHGHMAHLVLLGDSIFDNAGYVGREPDVATHLRRLLPKPWHVSLGAVDGAVTRDVAEQLNTVPGDATQLVL